MRPTVLPKLLRPLWIVVSLLHLWKLNLDLVYFLLKDLLGI